MPDSTPLNLQLVNFQRNNEKVGLVVDEYGDIQGLISVEDILEEIVGDFTTSMSPSLAEEVTRQPDGTLLIEGSANIREINKALNLSLPEEGARTINGLLLEELGDIPTLNTLVTVGNYQFEVVAIGENVIKTVKLSPLKPAGADIAADI